MSTKQLYEKTSEGMKEVSPLVAIEDIYSKLSDTPLEALVSLYNHVKCEWKGSVADTRRTVPLFLRRSGLFITYNNGTKFITEFFSAGADQITTEGWVKDSNWTPVPDDDYISAGVKPGVGSIGYEQLNDNLKQLFREKVNVTNYPDDEDIASVDNMLKLKDREVDAANFQSKGYVILRKNLFLVNGTVKNILTQDMINQANTIYEIRYDFDLNGKTINVPENCTLRFEGGSLNNGIIIGNNSTYIYNKHLIFKDIQLKYISEVYIDWFAESWNDDISDLINDLSKTCNTIIFSSRTYTCKKIIILRNGTNLIGNFATLIINSIKFESNNNVINFNIKNYNNEENTALFDISSNYAIRNFVKIQIDNICFYNNGDCNNIDLIRIGCGGIISGLHSIKISNIKSEGYFKTGINLKQEGNNSPFITNVLVIDCFFYDIRNAVILEQLDYNKPLVNIYQDIRFVRVESQYGNNENTFFTITGSQRLFIKDCTCWDIPNNIPQYIIKDKYVKAQVTGDFVDIFAQLYINNELQSNFNIADNITLCNNINSDSYETAKSINKKNMNVASSHSVKQFVDIQKNSNEGFIGHYYTSNNSISNKLIEYLLGINPNGHPSVAKREDDNNFDIKTIYSQLYFPYSYANSRPDNPVRGQIDFDCVTWLPIIFSPYNGVNHWVNTDGIQIDEKCFVPIVNNTTNLTQLHITSRGFKCYVIDLHKWCVWTGSRWETYDNHSVNNIRGTSNNRPNIPDWDSGFQYFDTTLNKPIWWTGTKWVDATGADV